MSESLNDHIETLRKKSRNLLQRIAENSEKLDKEVRKLHSHSFVSSINCPAYTNNYEPQTRKNFALWKQRNDSSGVSGLLHPDYAQINSTQMTGTTFDMQPTGKILLTSKNCPNNNSPKKTYRQPNKQCYCYAEIKKLPLRSAKPTCVSTYEFYKNKEAILTEDVTETDNSLSVCMTNETLRRVRSIDYVPKSQFLRNVQSKASVCEETSRVQSKGNKETEVVEDLQRTESSSRAGRKSCVIDEGKYAKCICVPKSDKEIHVASKKSSKIKPTVLLKKTIPSMKSVSVKKSEKHQKVPIRTKQTIHAFNYCMCCCSDVPPVNIKDQKQNGDLEKRQTRTEKSQMRMEEPQTRTKESQTRIEEFQTRTGEPQTRIEKARARQKEKRDSEVRSETERVSDGEVGKVQEFREQNYFETHGSSQTLLSNDSTGSLKRFWINDRLFPEPVRRIHREDLVVTMPACATKQRKRIHYFPRCIVPQEKRHCNTNYKNRRCQGCPLTGHAIDLGIFKTRPHFDSLALKYQKGVY